jgi:hypothetical protein
MKRLKTHLALAAVLVGLAIASMMIKPHSTSAQVSISRVELVPSVPFAETESGGFGLPATVKVPAGQTLIVETLSLQMDVTPSGSQLEASINYKSAGKSVTLSSRCRTCTPSRPMASILISRRRRSAYMRTQAPLSP